MFIKRILLFLFIITFIVKPALSVDTGFRNITGFGCHLTDGTCYFELEGTVFGPPECTSNQARFDVQLNANGHVWLSMIEAAYLANKRISLNITTDCYMQNYPTFSFGRIEK